MPDISLQEKKSIEKNKNYFERNQFSYKDIN